MAYHEIGDIIRCKYLEEEEPDIELVIDITTDMAKQKWYHLLNLASGKYRTLTFFTTNKNYGKVA